MSRILIVDDESEIASVLAEILRQEGHEASVAPSAWTALDRLTEAKPDLLLIDVMMPVISGLEMVRRVRAHPGHRSTPIILMSAIPPKVRQEDYGWTEFIQKPFPLERLLEALARHLGRAPEKINSPA